MKIDAKLLHWNVGKVKGFYGKELLKSEEASVKLVRIEPFSTFPQHIHPNMLEYAYVLAGTPEFFIDTTEYKGEVGDFFIFRANHRHSITNDTNLECILLIGAVKTETTTNL